MNKIKNVILILLVIFISSCKNKTNDKKTGLSDTSNKLKEEIDNYLKEQIQAHEIPGLAVAVVKNNEVIYKEYFGVENLENKSPVNEQTLFPVYSISKLISATAVFQLIEQDKLSLDDTLSQYIDNLPQQWQGITIENLLTHSTGLPDFSLIEGALTDEEMLSKISNDSIHFEKGNQWEYNQTNFWMLANIIEKVTNNSFDDFVLKNQFSDAKNGVLFSSNFTDKIPHRVYRYDFDNELGKLNKTDIIGGKRAHACNGLNISLDQMILWNKNLDADKLIKPDTKTEMWKPFEFKNDKRVFLYGWDSYLTNDVKSYGFTGGGQTGFRKFINQDITIIYLTNGHKYYSIHNIIIDHIAGIVDNKISSRPALLEEEVIAEFLKMDFENAKNKYIKVSDENPELNFEGTLNSLAYAFLRTKNIDYALKMFELNVKRYPNSSNVFDSFAEAYFVNNQLELSKINYQKSLELDPENTNAKKMIKRIEAKEMEK